MDSGEQTLKKRQGDIRAVREDYKPSLGGGDCGKGEDDSPEIGEIASAG